MKNLKWYHFVLLSILIVGFFYFISYKPKGGQLETLKVERINVEEDVRKSQVKKRQLDNVEAELKTMNSTLEQLEAIIPQRKEIGSILAKIQQLALNSQLTITRFAPQGQVNREFYSEWPINIELTGNYPNVRVFFDRLSNFSRLFTIENFSIQSLSKQTDSTTISVSFTAKTYIFHEEAIGKNPVKQTRARKS